MSQAELEATSHAELVRLCGAEASHRKTVEAERDRLRVRTHEIQEAADKRAAALQARVAAFDRAIDTAKGAAKSFKADWTADPPSQQEGGFWRYTSALTREVLIGFMGRTQEAEAERDRLRKAPRPMLAALQSWAENADESDELGPNAAEFVLQMVAEARAALKALDD